MSRVKTHTADLATRLIDEAGRLLDAEGPAALTTRRVAGQAGTSTTAVYSLFGDKAGLLSAMYAEGYRRLGTALGAVPVTNDPLQDLRGTGMAYREAALASAHLYELMFGHPVPEFQVDPANEPAVGAAFAPMLTTVNRCLDGGLLKAPAGMADPATSIAEHLWGTAHGLVSLELRGWLSGTRESIAGRYDQALTITAVGYLFPPTIEPGGGSTAPGSAG